MTPTDADQVPAGMTHDVCVEDADAFLPPRLGSRASRQNAPGALKRQADRFLALLGC
jgi:hypothetical protein